MILIVLSRLKYYEIKDEYNKYLKIFFIFRGLEKDVGHLNQKLNQLENALGAKGKLMLLCLVQWGSYSGI